MEAYARKILEGLSLSDSMKEKIDPFRSIDKNDIYCFGVGKASVSMVEIVQKELGLKDQHCFALAKPGAKLASFDTLYGDHPTPGTLTKNSTLKFIEHLKQIPESAHLLFCLSGGSSSLLELPKEGVSWEEVIQLSKHLLESDITIREMNQRRAEVSEVKAGGLLSFIGTKKVTTLVLSDVPYDDVGIVGSGPTVGSPTRVIMDWKDLLHAGLGVLDCKGFKPKGPDKGSLEENLPRILDQVKQLGIFAGVGELHNEIWNSGQGGRCTHFVATVAKELFIKDVPGLTQEKLAQLVVFAFASDGQDGPGENTGAWLRLEDFIEFPNLKEDLEVGITEFNTLSVLQQYDRTFDLGQTGLNLMDFYFVGRTR